MAAKTTTAPAKKTAPKKVLPATKLTAVQIDVVAVLHENDKWYPVDLVVLETGLPEKQVITTLKKLVEMGYALAKEDGTAFRYTGLRCKALRVAIGALRLQGAPMSAGEIGAAVWADPKVAAKDPKAGTRYMAAAYAVLKTAFTLGAVYRIESDEAPQFGAVA